jgi:hypothetical protein
MALSSRILLQSIARVSPSRPAHRQRQWRFFRRIQRLPSHPALVIKVEQRFCIILFSSRSDLHQRQMLPP